MEFYTNSTSDTYKEQKCKPRCYFDINRQIWRVVLLLLLGRLFKSMYKPKISFIFVTKGNATEDNFRKRISNVKLLITANLSSDYMIN